MAYRSYLLSFPTRRSSDLARSSALARSRPPRAPPRDTPAPSAPDAVEAAASIAPLHAASSRSRSEEHTSELQSPCNVVCRLVLEQKNWKPYSVKTAPSAHI